jgi:phenylalanine-4-hydroxylase
VAGFFVFEAAKEAANAHLKTEKRNAITMLISTDGGELLLDHVDARKVVANGDDVPDRNALVQLDPDHPGFRDAEYRSRRNAIAEIAMSHKSGAPIAPAPYTEQEHAVWKTIWSALESAHRTHACAEYLACLDRLAFDTDRIPQLDEVSQKVEALSGFRLEPVAGLVEPRVFLESLANGVFLCTQYIRHHSTPLYTPEPDVAHEIIGHAVTLASPRFARINRMFGEAVRRTNSASDMDLLARIYWFTIEFGVLREDGQVKAYGTGLLSSAGELEEMHKAQLLPLDLETAANHPYDPTHYQAILFCADSFDEMDGMLTDYLARWCEQ